MKSLIPPQAEPYLYEWTVTLALGGAVCVAIGIASGWIIWRKARKFSESVEAGNRTALADYERTSDEVSRLKSELAGGR